ncbi:MAG: YHS domain-containing protein [Raineya sp.]|jgi:YHS domain-containing protein|nr:YHS domain-containing protein [Raineya sp.]
MKNILLIIMLLTAVNSVKAQDETAKRKKHYNVSKNSLALEGYDVVSYFTLTKPIKGDSKYSTFYQGVVYYFSSQANLSAFKTNPSKYEPAYGGWCAYAMGAKGTKVEVDVKNYKVKNGRLFLFYKDFFSNTLDDWNDDETNLKTKADKNWQNVYR